MSPPLAPILSHMNQVHTFPQYFLKSILILPSHSGLRLQSCASFRCSDQNPECISLLPHARKTLTNLITLDMIVSRHAHGEEHQTRSSSLSYSVKLKNTYIINNAMCSAIRMTYWDLGVVAVQYTRWIQECCTWLSRKLLVLIRVRLLALSLKRTVDRF
jgi:hypothetical protein